jgi:membrane associated rhomboid family serine protease
MIPLRNDVQAKQQPFVNYILIGTCSLMFGLQLFAGPNNAQVVERLGMVPARLTAPAGEAVLVPEQYVIETAFGPQVASGFRPIEPAAVPEWLTLVTCVFLHGGWLHFLGNMWFLKIFGDKVEDRLGHVAYAALYLGTGVVAGMCHLIVNFDSVAPTIGASGAIAGVMGSYFYLFPHSRVVTLIPMIFLWPVIELPAQVFLGVWFLMQFWSGTFAVVGQEVAGVAWWAHIGGFLAGLACGAALGRTPPPPPAIEEPRQPDRLM